MSQPALEAFGTTLPDTSTSAPPRAPASTTHALAPLVEVAVTYAEVPHIAQRIAPPRDEAARPLPIPADIVHRFSAAKFVSAALGVVSAPLLAHAAVVQSRTALAIGGACIVIAITIQAKERLRARRDLVRIWIEQGIPRQEAHAQANRALRAWLEAD